MTREAQHPKTRSANDMRKWHGYEQEQWDKAKEEARRHLILLASGQMNTTYKQMTDHIHAIVFESNDSTYHELLGEISASEHRAGRGMLSVLVVREDTKVPAIGFYKLAILLGIQVEDRDEFWVSEFRKVTDYWTKECPPEILEKE